MISPSKALASATESAVLPLAVGPPTATTPPRGGAGGDGECYGSNKSRKVGKVADGLDFRE